jgi:hypothetical protein
MVPQVVSNNPVILQQLTSRPCSLATRQSSTAESAVARANTLRLIQRMGEQMSRAESQKWPAPKANNLPCGHSNGELGEELCVI